MWNRLVRLMDQREPPHVLAAVRIVLSTILFADLMMLAHHRLIIPFFAPIGAGGWRVNPDDSRALVYALLPATADGALLFFWMWVAAVVAFALGLWTRLSGLALVLLSAQSALLFPTIDRGIDTLIRNAVLILVCSGSHHVWSLDAKLRVPTPTVPAWPRHLLMLQVIWLYFTSGFLKLGHAWTPVGGYSALYVVLHDPAVTRFSLGDISMFYPVTQVATAATVLWEMAAPVLLWLLYLRATRARGGWLRKRVGWAIAGWLSFGICFHLGTAALLTLGIFPFAVMSLYLSFIRPPSGAS